MIEGVEADDIIGILSMYNTETTNIIYGGDKDFKQCILKDGVYLYDTYKNVFQEREGIDKWVFEHMLKGDTGDGIFNIFTDPKEKIESGIRQKTISSKYLNEMYYLWKDDEGTFLSKLEEPARKRFETNRTIVNFDYMPLKVKEKIQSVFNEKKDDRRIFEAFNDFCLQNYLVNLTTEIGVI